VIRDRVVAGTVVAAGAVIGGDVGLVAGNSITSAAWGVWAGGIVAALGVAAVAYMRHLDATVLQPAAEAEATLDDLLDGPVVDNSADEPAGVS
jgi:hypothetical protein